MNQDRARPGDRWQEGFWAGVDAGGVALQRCAKGHAQLPGGAVCGTCGETVEWVPANGTGTIWSWAVFHQRYFPDFAPLLPYTVLVVQLDEGPRLYSGLHPQEQRQPVVGDAVELVVGDFPHGPVPLVRLVGP